MDIVKQVMLKFGEIYYVGDAIIISSKGDASKISPSVKM